MNEVMITGRPVELFQERCAGNLSWGGAHERLRRLLLRARFSGVRPGHARLYTLGDMRFLVQGGAPITVYRQQYTPTLPTEDLWCAA